MAKPKIRLRGTVQVDAGPDYRLEVKLTEYVTPNFTKPLQKVVIEDEQMIRKWEARFSRLDPGTIYLVKAELYRGAVTAPIYATTRAFRTED